jgi:membrane-bound metal-dependent hydrolase YbcI (DUF457 family)
MKWQNHKLCNAAIIYGITGNLQATVLSTIGSVLPDVLELNGVIRHRTITHYPYIYFVPLLFVALFMNQGIYTQIAFWITIGCITHLFFDSLSKSGIPYKYPYGNAKIALNLYTTHQISEWYISITVAIIFGMLARFNGYLYTNHFVSEITNIIRFNKIILSQ